MKRNLTMEDLKFHHLINKLPASKFEIPSPGYYHLIDRLPSYYGQEESRYNGYLFAAFYNPFESEFEIQFKVPILTWALYNYNSTGPTELTLDELVGAIIHVKEVAIHKSTIINPVTHEEHESPSYKIIWDLITYLPVSDDLKSSAITDNSNELVLLNADMELNPELDEVLEDANADFDEELEAIFDELDTESYEDEMELIFWEANQPIDNEDEMVFWEANQSVASDEEFAYDEANKSDDELGNIEN